MSTTVTTGWLKDKNGDKFAPKTLSSQVATSDGTTLNTKLDDIQTQLDGKQPTITGAATTITSDNLTTGKVLISDSNGKVAVSDITSTELGYLNDVSSNVQTQLDGKADSSHSHSASNITSGTLSSDRLPTVPISKGGTGATTAENALTNLGITATASELNKLDGVTTTTTQLNYLNTTTSDIQTQLDGKLPTDGIAAKATADAQGNRITSTYMKQSNPTGTGSFSMNRMSASNTGDYSIAVGYKTSATATCSHAEGNQTYASGVCAHAEGYETGADGECSHAEGHNTIAQGSYSHAEGENTTAYGKYSHAEGSSYNQAYDLITDLDGATNDEIIQTWSTYTDDAQESFTLAKGEGSHAEGYSTLALGFSSHAEGEVTIAKGQGSHAEGIISEANGSFSHAEGCGTIANGMYSHAEGCHTTASGTGSHAEGNETTALDYQHVQGHYNNTSTAAAGIESGTSTDTKCTAFVIGNGTSSSASNAFRVTYGGKPYAKSTLTTTGADYAEFFEWKDLNPDNEDRRGYFVTLDEDKIKIAEPNDYILGIISGQPSVVGNGDEDWMGRYVFDEFGAFVYEDFEYETEVPEEIQEEVTNEETGETTLVTKTVTKTVKKTGTKYKENPDYDPTISYIHREDRPEWDCVGMLGVLSVRDDGTCKVNGYCKVAEGGIATTSETGYRVIKRVSDNVVKVIFR